MLVFLCVCGSMFVCDVDKDQCTDCSQLFAKVTLLINSLVADWPCRFCAREDVLKPVLLVPWLHPPRCYFSAPNDFFSSYP